MEQDKSRTQILKEMQKEFVDQKNILLDTVAKNDNKIMEIERYLNSLFEKEDRDYKVFSPRDVESIYKDKIEQEKIVKSKIENDNQYLYKKIGFLADKVDKLEYVLSDCDKQTALNSQKISSGNDSFSIIEMQEQERQRIARDLHDSIVQSLIHVIHKIELSSKFIDQDIIRAKLELYATNVAVKEAIEELRGTIYNLRPMDLDDLGFTISLQRLKKELEDKSDKTMEVVFNIGELENENDVLLMTLYRIIQECCMNVLKHAKASLLSLSIENLKDKIILKIRDNGIGFDIVSLKENRNKSFGLKMTKERVQLLSGIIQIESHEGKGTIIVIEIPKT